MPRPALRRYLRHGMLPQLAVFDSAARLGSYTRAAESLHLAQPTVSTQLRKLSETLGVALFEQIGKKVHLTPAGVALRDGCEELFGVFERIEESLAQLRTLESGRLRLAAGTSGQYFLTRLLAAFAERHPGIDLSLHIGNREALCGRLARNDDDLYVFANPPLEQEVVCQTILPNPMALVARADHRLARGGKIRLAVLAEEPFLMRERGSGTRTVVEEIFRTHGLEPRVRLELSSDEAIKQGILAGLGISILSRHALDSDSASAIAQLEVEGFPVLRQWQFVYPVGKQVAPAARAFMDFVRAEA